MPNAFLYGYYISHKEEKRDIITVIAVGMR